MDNHHYDVKLSPEQVQYVTGQINLGAATKAAITQARTSGTARLTRSQRAEVLNALGARLQRTGFDKHYAPTDEGSILESLIDRFQPDNQT